MKRHNARVLSILAASSLLCAEVGFAATPSGYEVVDKEDISFGSQGTKQEVIRWEYRIKVTPPINEKRLRAICAQVIRKHTEKTPVNAIGFFFFLPDSDPNGHYTAGKAIWAPKGDWARAHATSHGDYKYHKLVVETGSALGIKAPTTTAKLSLSQKKALFSDLVLLQDKGVVPKRSYEIIAKKYRVTAKEVIDIQLQGAVNGWPMP